MPDPTYWSERDVWPWDELTVEERLGWHALIGRAINDDPQAGLIDALTDAEVNECLTGGPGKALVDEPCPTPALEAWRRRGDTRTRDGLWLAACWEAAASGIRDPDKRAEFLAEADRAMMP